MELAGADPELRAEAVAEAVGEARRGVVVDARRVHRLHEARRRRGVLRHDGLGVARAVALDVPDRLVEAADGLNGDDEVGVFRRPVVRGGWQEIVRRDKRRSARASAHFDSGGAQTREQFGQEDR